MTYTTGALPNMGVPPLDESGRWNREWVAYWQAINNRTGGNGSPIDINTLQQQDEISQDVPPQNAATIAALQGINDLWAEQRPPENLSLLLARLDAMESALSLQPDLSSVPAKLNDLEAWLAEIRQPVSVVLEQWNAPTLINSWVNYGAPYNSAGYWKDPNGVVHLRGLVKSGAGVIFVLPSGYRPAAEELFAIVSNNAFGRIDVDASGNVNPLVGTNAYFSLDGITFRAAN